MLSASDHVIQSNVEVKLEGSSKAVMSPQSNSSSSSRQDDKKMNNNSVSYTAGGRLKFFKGKILPKWLFMLFKNIAYSYCLFFGDKKEACVEQKQHKHACHFDLFECLASDLKENSFPIMICNMIQLNCNYWCSLFPKMW